MDLPTWPSSDMLVAETHSSHLMSIFFFFLVNCKINLQRFGLFELYTLKFPFVSKSYPFVSGLIYVAVKWHADNQNIFQPFDVLFFLPSQPSLKNVFSPQANSTATAPLNDIVSLKKKKNHELNAIPFKNIIFQKNTQTCFVFFDPHKPSSFLVLSRLSLCL